MAFGDIIQTNSGLGTTGTTSPTLPSPVTAGNRVVLCFASDDYNGTVSAGWTESPEMEQQTFHGGYLWWLDVSSDGMTIPNYVIGSAVRSHWVLVEIEGPFESGIAGSEGQFQQTSTDSYTTPTLTPAAGNLILIAALNFQHAASDLGTPSSSWQGSFTQVSATVQNGANPRLAVGVAKRMVTADGVTGYSSGVTLSIAQAAQSKSGLIIAFEEGAPPVPPDPAKTAWFSPRLFTRAWFSPDMYLAGWGDEENIEEVDLGQTGTASGTLAWSGTAVGKRTPVGTSNLPTGTATLTSRAANESSNNANTVGAAYTTTSFTPTAGDRLLVLLTLTGDPVSDWGSVTASANGITFSRVGSPLLETINAFEYRQEVWVSDQVVPGSPSSMTVSFVKTSTDLTNGGAWAVLSVAGAQRVGPAIIERVATDKATGSDTPSMVFSAAVDAGNPTAYIVSGGSGTAQTGEVGWTEVLDSAHNAPQTATGVYTRASGFAGTTINHGTASTGHVSTAVEVATAPALAWRGAATGKRDPKGTASGSLAWSGSAVGAAPRSGTATGTLAWVGTATGKRSPVGTATGSLAWVGTATANEYEGDATGTLAWVGTATGKRNPVGTVSGNLAWSGTAVGKRTPVGTGSGTLAWSGTATGKRSPVGSASGTLAWSGAAVGSSIPSGTATGTLAWSGTAVGKRSPVGTASGTLAWVGTAAADEYEGDASGTLSWVGTATGKRSPVGSGSGTLVWSGTAAGKRTPKGSASGTLAWSGTAVGNSPGTGTGTAGGSLVWSGTATGKRSPKGSASGALAWVGTATGKRTALGTAGGSLAWGGAATGKRVAKATASGSLVWTGVAVGTGGSRSGTATGSLAWVGTAAGVSGEYSTPVDRAAVVVNSPRGFRVPRSTPRQGVLTEAPAGSHAYTVPTDDRVRSVPDRPHTGSVSGNGEEP